MRKSVELYISKNLHIEHVKHSGQELAKRNLGLLDFYYNRIERIDRLSPTNTNNTLLIRETLSPADLPLTERERLELAEEKLAEIMKKLGLETTPEKTDANAEKILEKLPPFGSTKDAMEFLKAVSARLDYLLSDASSKRLDTIRHLAYFYLESRIVNMAIFKGIYLIPPKPGLIQQGIYKYSVN